MRSRGSCSCWSLKLRLLATRFRDAKKTGERSQQAQPVRISYRPKNRKDRKRLLSSGLIGHVISLRKVDSSSLCNSCMH